MQDRREYLLFQYKNSPSLSTIYDGLFPIFRQASPRDLMNFFDIDRASDKWLDAIGEIFGITRYYSTISNLFILDIDKLDDSSIRLDGEPSSINDEEYRSLIKVFLFRKGKHFTIENIYEVIQNAFNPYSIDIIDGNGEVTINLVFSDLNALRKFNSLYNINNNLLGVPTGGKVIINRSVL